MGNHLPERSEGNGSERDVANRLSPDTVLKLYDELKEQCKKDDKSKKPSGYLSCGGDFDSHSTLSSSYSSTGSDFNDKLNSSNNSMIEDPGSERNQRFLEMSNPAHLYGEVQSLKPWDEYFRPTDHKLAISDVRFDPLSKMNTNQLAEVLTDHVAKMKPHYWDNSESKIHPSERKERRELCEHIGTVLDAAFVKKGSEGLNELIKAYNQQNEAKGLQLRTETTNVGRIEIIASKKENGKNKDIGRLKLLYDKEDKPEVRKMWFSEGCAKLANISDHTDPKVKESRNLLSTILRDADPESKKQWMVDAFTDAIKNVKVNKDGTLSKEQPESFKKSQIAIAEILSDAFKRDGNQGVKDLLDDIRRNSKQFAVNDRERDGANNIGARELIVKDKTGGAGFLALKWCHEDPKHQPAIDTLTNIMKNADFRVPTVSMAPLRQDLLQALKDNKIQDILDAANLISPDNVNVELGKLPNGAPTIFFKKNGKVEHRFDLITRSTAVPHSLDRK